MAGDWRDLSVLVVGCGSIGKRHGRILQELGVRDIRACDPAITARDQMADCVAGVSLHETYENGLNDRPNCVLICTAPKLHVPMALKAIEAGCDVLCEKPLSDSEDGVDELIALAEREQKKVMVALCFRYHEGILKARQQLRSGCVGRVVSIRALMGEHLPEIRPDYRDLFVSKYMGAFDLMHDIDLAIWFADSPIKDVQCLAGNYSDIGIAAPDMVEMLIDFEDRCAATVHLDFFQRPRRRQLELLCTEGTIIVEFSRWDRCTVSVYDRQQWRHETLATDRDDMFRAEDREFLEAVVSRGPIASTIQESRKSLRAVIAAMTADK